MATAWYTTVEVGEFSATLAVAPEVIVGASLTSVMLTVTALVLDSAPPSVATTLMLYEFLASKFAGLFRVT